MADPDKTGDVTAAAVYHLWYSLVETVLDDKGIPTETAANGRPAVAPTHLPIFKQLATGKDLCPLDMPMPVLEPVRTYAAALADSITAQHAASTRDTPHRVMSVATVRPSPVRGAPASAGSLLDAAALLPPRQPMRSAAAAVGQPLEHHHGFGALCAAGGAVRAAADAAAASAAHALPLP
eukprot:TRINITY_DN2536_c0_g2_i1.p1 TRINITY_DN2536_c0_g2~~TRINITY_DN2536_c0_g2_i1.p1  ORF type:complete len:210 (+),score=58.78 TRINITY_DN2536_c0_g2_i1:92-631(+)